MAGDFSGLAATARNLDGQILSYTTPPELTHPVLKAFTQTALNSSTATALAMKLDMARDQGWGAG